MNSKTTIKLLIQLIISTCFIVSCSDDSDTTSDNNTSNCEKTNCANYNSQREAQAAFNLDPECRKNLDHDNDGFACEEPGNDVTPKPTTSCATTANCGCSGKNKSPCQNDPCCKWIVGDGCQCK